MVEQLPSLGSLDLAMVGEDIQVLPPEDGKIRKVVMKFGGSSKLIASPQVGIHIDGAYAASGITTYNAILDYLLLPLYWMKPCAYLVGFDAIHGIQDGTSQPVINMTNYTTGSGTSIFSDVTLSTSVQKTGLVASTDNYDINRGDKIEIRVITAGTSATSPAMSLTVMPYFVEE